MLKAKKLAPVYSIADEVANLTKNKVDDESDQDEESDLVIEMPAEDDDKEKGKHANNQQSKCSLYIFCLSGILIFYIIFKIFLYDSFKKILMKVKVLSYL